MIIRLSQPALALHSCDVPGYKYRMQTTWQMPPKATVSNVVYWIETAIQNAGGYLSNVVINCHGNNGYLAVGGVGSGFGIEGTSIFESLGRAGRRIGRIWLIACSVTGGEGGIGKHFCQALAKAANCNVVAGAILQETGTLFDLFHPYGCIDDFEGQAFEFESNGQVYTWNNDLGTEF